MSTVIGLTRHKSQLENGYSCVLPESPQQQLSSLNCGFHPCLNFGLEVAPIMEDYKSILTRGKLNSEQWSSVCCSSVPLKFSQHGSVSKLAIVDWRMTDSMGLSKTGGETHPRKLDLIALGGYKWCVALNNKDYLGKLFHMCTCSRSRQTCSVFKDIRSHLDNICLAYLWHNQWHLPDEKKKKKLKGTTCRLEGFGLTITSSRQETLFFFFFF